MEVRYIAPGEEEICNNFHNKWFKRNRSIAQWKWEFIPRIFTRPPTPFAVAVDNGNIIGTQAFIPIRMIDKDGIHWTAKSEETLVDPAYRGKGLSPKMYSLLFEYAREQEIAYVWGFTTAVKALTPSNFEFPFNTSQLFMPFSIRSIPAMMTKNVYGKKEKFRDKFKVATIQSACVVAEAASALKVASLKKRSHWDFDIRVMTRPDDQSGELCSRFIKKWGGTTIYRDAPYLQWRLFDNPYAKSIVKGIYDKDELLGWVAYTIGDDGMGSIVDLLAPCDSSQFAANDLIKAMLLEAIVGTQNMGATGVRGWRVNNYGFDKLINAVARDIGFYHIKRGSTFVLYTSDWGKRRISYSKFDDWYISRIYTDGTLG